MQSNITLHDLIPTIKEVVDAGGEATFVPNGRSMKPMLYGGRDKIILKKPEFPLNKYDIPLYLRADKTVVLHRIVKVSDTENGRKYFMRGDNTWPLESDVEQQNIVAVLTRFCRKGKWYNADDTGHILYARLWCFLFPLRFFVYRCLNLAVRIIKKLGRIIRGR